MRHSQIIVEHVLNLISKEDRTKYKDVVWDLMQKSYARVGGFKSAVSPEELVDTTNLWKLVVRTDAMGEKHITAANVYRDQHGRKSVAAGTDGSTQGKKDYMMIKDDDVKLMRAWAEVSGAPEAIFRKAGAKPLLAKFAAELTGKEIISYDDDGYHYVRLILGEPHTKMLMGWPQVDGDLAARIEAESGADIHSQNS